MKRVGSVRRRLAGEGGFISGLVLRMAVGIVLLAIAVNDGGKLVGAQVKAESVARAAATAGADTWWRTHRDNMAMNDAAAAAQITDPTAKIISIEIDHKVGTVTVRVETQADTLVVKRLGFLKKYGTQDASDSETRLP